MSVQKVGRGRRVITVPMAFTIKDMRSSQWRATRGLMLDHVRTCYIDLLDKEEAKLQKQSVRRKS